MQGISQVALTSPKTGSRRSTREPVGACRRGIGPIVGRLESRKAMLNQELKDLVVSRILPSIRTPGQYVGGELNSVAKDHRTVAGNRLPGVPRHLRPGHEPPRAPGALQPDERRGLGLRAGVHAAARLRGRPCAQHGLPLYSLETFTPLDQFDVLGFSLQYEICYTNVLTMLDLGGIALHAEDRGPDDTLVIAGGPGAQNPELLAPFIDLFVIGDGEPSLPVVCDLWKSMKGSGLSREEKLARIAGSVEWAYVPRFYEPIYREDGTILEIRRTRDDVPEEIKPCVIRDLDEHPAADPADRPVRRDDARPDRHRDHARLPLAVPVLPEHGHQAAAPPSHRRDDRPGRARELRRHRLRRDQPAVALDQRLPRFRGAGRRG